MPRPPRPFWRSEPRPPRSRRSFQSSSSSSSSYRSRRGGPRPLPPNARPPRPPRPPRGRARSYSPRSSKPSSRRRDSPRDSGLVPSPYSMTRKPPAARTRAPRGERGGLARRWRTRRGEARRAWRVAWLASCECGGGCEEPPCAFPRPMRFLRSSLIRIFIVCDFSYIGGGHRPYGCFQPNPN